MDEGDGAIVAFDGRELSRHLHREAIKRAGLNEADAWIGETYWHMGDDGELLYAVTKLRKAAQ